MPAVRRRALVASGRPMMTSYEAGLSMFPDLDGVHPDSRFPVGRLGLDFASLVAFIPGGGIAGPASGIIGDAASMIGDLTGGAKTDAARLQRVNWTVQQAQRGSVLAAEIILGAPAKVGSNERAMWTAAASKIPQSVLQQAMSLSPGGWWPDGQPDFYTDVNGSTHQQIMQQVNAASQTAVAVGSAVSTGVRAVTQVPAWLWVGGLAVAGFAFAGGRRKRGG